MKFFKYKDGQLRTTIIIKRNLSKDDLINCVLDYIRYEDSNEAIDLKLTEITRKLLYNIAIDTAKSKGYSLDFVRDDLYNSVKEYAEEQATKKIETLFPFFIKI